MAYTVEHLMLLEQSKRRARVALAGLLSDDLDDRIQALAALMPRDEDFAEVFIDSFSEAAAKATHAAWSRAVPPTLGDRTELALTATWSELVATASEFPGGYRRLAGKLHPGRVWFVFRFVRPGERSGLAFDGLVEMTPGRFAWFPKPWRAARSTPPTS